MLAIRSATACLTSRLTRSALALVCFLALVGRDTAGPLPGDGVDEYKVTLTGLRQRGIDEPIPVSELVRFRRDLREEGRKLYSLGEVTKVLLLDWGEVESSDVEPPANSQRVREAAQQTDDEVFRQKVSQLLNAIKDDDTRARASEQVAREIKRQARDELLDRFERAIRFYLANGRPTDRIAAANLIGETMISEGKRNEVALPEAAPDDKKKNLPPGSLRDLRGRLQGLYPELEKLLRDRDQDVQVAAARALSALESDDPVKHAARLQSLLSPSESAPARRAAARALSAIIRVTVKGRRPRDILRTMGAVFPAAVKGLSDADELTRQYCAEACEEIASRLAEMVSDRPRLRMADQPQPTVQLSRAEARQYKAQILKVIRENLPALNGVISHIDPARRPPENNDVPVRDPVVQFRVSVLRALEDLATVIDSLEQTGESLPPPKPRRAVRNTNPLLGSSSPADAEVVATLGQPTRVGAEEQAKAAAPTPYAVQQVSFSVRKGEDLHQPKPVADNMAGTVQAMIAGLSDPDFRVRLVSIDVLEIRGLAAEPAIPALVRALRDPNKFVRWAAARTLGKLAPRQGEDVVPALLRMLDDREDMGVRITAAKAIREYGKASSPAVKQAVPVLARVINRGDKEYIIAVMETIQGIGTDAQAALPSVAWILRNRELPSNVRVVAARTLGRFGPLASHQLKDLRAVITTDPDDDLRQEASRAVLAIDRREAK
jgi:HEAT repeat protein